jgi:hypothetical protein
VCVCVCVCVCRPINSALKKCSQIYNTCSAGRKKTFLHENRLTSPVTALSKALVSGRSIAGVAGSKPAWGVDVSLFSLMCVVW